jgi:hypothetical protein
MFLICFWRIEALDLTEEDLIEGAVILKEKKMHIIIWVNGIFIFFKYAMTEFYSVRQAKRCSIIHVPNNLGP